MSVSGSANKLFYIRSKAYYTFINRFLMNENMSDTNFWLLTTIIEFNDRRIFGQIVFIVKYMFTFDVRRFFFEINKKCNNHKLILSVERCCITCRMKSLSLPAPQLLKSSHFKYKLCSIGISADIEQRNTSKHM